MFVDRPKRKLYQVWEGGTRMLLKPFIENDYKLRYINEQHDKALMLTFQGIYAYKTGFVELANSRLREAASDIHKVSIDDSVTEKDRQLAAKASRRLEKIATDMVAREFRKALRN